MSHGLEGLMVDEIGPRGRDERLAATRDDGWAHSPAFLAWMAGCVRRPLEFAGMRGFVRGTAA